MPKTRVRSEAWEVMWGVPSSGLWLCSAAHAQALAQRIAGNASHALRLTKRLLREGQHMRLESLLEMSAGFQAIAHKTAHHVEAITAFVEKRKPDFSGE